MLWEKGGSIHPETVLTMFPLRLTWLRRSLYTDTVEAKFLSGVFSPLTSAEACEKRSRWIWTESCVSAGVKKPGNNVRH